MKAFDSFCHGCITAGWCAQQGKCLAESYPEPSTPPLSRAALEALMVTWRRSAHPSDWERADVLEAALAQKEPR